MAQKINEVSRKRAVCPNCRELAAGLWDYYNQRCSACGYPFPPGFGQPICRTPMPLTNDDLVIIGDFLKQIPIKEFFRNYIKRAAGLQPEEADKILDRIIMEISWRRVS